MTDRDHDIINSLARASEGVSLALKNRCRRREAEANIEYAQANLAHVLKLIDQERRDFHGSGQLHKSGPRPAITTDRPTPTTGDPT